MQIHNPKHFTLQLGSLIALYVAVIAFLVLAFNIINIKFPDAAEYWYTAESARAAIRGAIATLIVFYPTYLVLTRISNQARRKETKGEYTVLGKWLVYFSILVGGAVLLGNLVTLVLYFLNGEITERFILKVLILGIVVGASLAYYALDVRGYFMKRMKYAVSAGLVVTALVLTGIIYGYLNIETPAVVREMRLDDQQVTDLQDMQWRIEEYARNNEILPESLAALYISNAEAAPEGRAAYRYSVTNEMEYKLCATFASSSEENNSDFMGYGFDKNFSWEHGAGEWCFERMVSYE